MVVATPFACFPISINLFAVLFARSIANVYNYFRALCTLYALISVFTNLFYCISVVFARPLNAFTS